MILKLQIYFHQVNFHILQCFLETIYHNDVNTIKHIFKNLYFWLNDDGILFINLFLKEKLDPAPREFSQYYYDENKTKHSLTYFENFTHDAWWKNDKYYEQIVNKDGKYLIKIHDFHIPHEDKMVQYLNSTGFKVIDLLKYDDIDMNDMVLCILQKHKQN